MRVGRSVVGTIVGTVLVAGMAGADGPSRFVTPRTKAEWDERKPTLARAIREAIVEGSPEAPRDFTPNLGGGGRGFGFERFYFRGSSGKRVDGYYYVQAGPASSERRPAVIYLAEGKDASLGPHLEPPEPVKSIAAMGIAVLWLEVEPAPNPVARLGRWPQVVRDDQFAYDTLLRLPGVDPDRVGVLGVGEGGLRAVWLMALNEKIAPGMAVGGMSRLSDWSIGGPDRPGPPWLARLMDGKDTDAVVALTAGRPLEWTIGERDPSCPAASVRIIETAGNAASRLVTDHNGFHATHLGRMDGRYGRLQWMAAAEVFEKAFVPQGPTPLGHAPEPEPVVTSDFVDLAANGLAGWVPEMSQRPGTWTWADGVIACKPGPNEYGWLRAPVEVGDFVLTIEWKVPPRGNTGVFLRAKPVPWTFPPSAANKRIVSALGLDWPSRTGLELQAQDDPGQASKYSSGSLYRHAGVAANPTNPPGQWNRYTVRARGPCVEVWTNGQQVLDARIDRLPLTLPDPPLRGYIGLQNHGAQAEFRNVKLRRLDR